MGPAEKAIGTFLEEYQGGIPTLTEEAKVRWVWNQLPPKLQKALPLKKLAKFLEALEDEGVLDKAATATRISLPVAINIMRVLQSLGLA
jgi:hypothetical protein